MNAAPLIIFGAGGHGRVVLDSLMMTGKLPMWVIDDHPPCKELYGVSVLSSSDIRWRSLRQFRFIVAIGENKIRAKVFKKLLDRGGTPFSLIHPNAFVSPSARIGLGSVVMAGVIVNTGSEVGRNVILNTASSIDHDCWIGPDVHLGPGTRLAGSVKIGEMTVIGTGSSIIPKLNIGAYVVVGAGSVIVRNLPDRVKAFGNPGRIRGLMPSDID